MTTGLGLREFFHLAFLRQISARLAGRGWSVKGGICLRFFHRSPRLSEDIDLDSEPRIRMETLRNAMDTILESRAFSAMLAVKGIAAVRFSAPKQTPTVQRWKVSLDTGGNLPLSTKIEFSRRRSDTPFSRGTPSAEVLERHSMPPFIAQFYGPAEIAAQKITAIVSASRHVARDLFDLDHLFSVVRADPAESLRMAGQDRATVLDKVDSFSFRDFREEVLPYLDEDMMRDYARPESFTALQSRVREALPGPEE